MSARKPARVIKSGKKIRSIQAFSLRKFTDQIQFILFELVSDGVR